MPVATVMPGIRKPSVARPFEKIEEVDYPSSLDVGESIISPVLEPESVHTLEADAEASVTLLTNSFENMDSSLAESTIPAADKFLVQQPPIEKPNVRKPSIRNNTHLSPASIPPHEQEEVPSEVPPEVPSEVKEDKDAVAAVEEPQISDKKRKESVLAKELLRPSVMASTADSVSGSDNNSHEETIASDTLAPLTPTISPRRTFTANLALREKQRESVDSLGDSVDEHKADVSINDESVQSVRSRGGRANRSRSSTAHRQSSAGDQSRLGSTGGMSRSSSKDESSLRADSHYRSLMSTLLSLVDIKANVKKELKDWAVQFEQEHNRPPGNEDKAVISDRFLTYKMVGDCNLHILLFVIANPAVSLK